MKNIWFFAFAGAWLLTSCQHRTNPILQQQGAVSIQDGSVTLSREVRNPGKYEWCDGMRLKDALLLAGGVTDFAASGEVRINHRDGTIERYKVEAVMNPNGPNPELEPGDRIKIVIPYF